MLQQEGEFGNVQSEILLHKDPGVFTFGGGWGFPRKISFNGDECVIPNPDQYPTLPNAGNKAEFGYFVILFSFLFLLVMF